jgi:hypothetical protein
VAAQQRALGGVERAALGEDVGRDRQLPDVVELGRAGDVPSERSSRRARDSMGERHTL